MSQLWFTTHLETISVDDDDDAFASPFRINRSSGESDTFYRLTPSTFAWIRLMMQRAEAKCKAGGFPESKLLELKKRCGVISSWATKRFTATEIDEAAKGRAALPIEPCFSFDFD